MRASKLSIHNFRSFTDTQIALTPYTLLVGANNTGKSNIIEAIRIFYEDVKYDPARDVPSFATTDNDSWIEMEFLLSDNEFSTLKEDYKLPDNRFRVRKYLGVDGKPKAGIYAYEGGQISNNLFYGAKNIQQDKFGEIIYIPAVSKLDEHTKFSGPSALRDLVNLILKRIVDTSVSYKNLTQAFGEFEGQIKTEETPEGYSLQKLEAEITGEIASWGTSFEFHINPISPEEVVKNLIDSKIRDPGLNKEQDPKLHGQGFQRHLIFSLIRLAAQYNTKAKAGSARKEFSPRFTWILFEEPEAFLHPSQIEVLNASLREISKDQDNQILITTHSPLFISKNVQDLPSMARLYKEGVKSFARQIDLDTLNGIFTANQADYQKWKDAGVKIDGEDWRLDMEAVKYMLWLNPLRCAAFFANKVLLVEGPTETALIGYLIDGGRIPNPKGGLFLFDTLGKYNIHRFMNLFGALGIPHAVLYDHDNTTQENVAIHATIETSKNSCTLGTDTFAKDIETFLGIERANPNRCDRKPQHVMWHVAQGKVEESRLDALAAKVSTLLSI